MPTAPVTPDGPASRRPLPSVLVLCLTVALVTAPVTAVVAPGGGAPRAPGSEAAAGNEGGPEAATAGNDPGRVSGVAGNDAPPSLGTAGNDGGVPAGTVSPDAGQSAPAPPDTSGAPDAGAHLSGPANVTLVTGTTVTVSPGPNGTAYRVHGNASAETVHTDRGTYVFPADADLSTFDRNLFNVDLLVAQDLTDAETDAVPVIVTRAADAGDGTIGTKRVGRGPPDVEGLAVERPLSGIGAVAGSVAKPTAGGSGDPVRAGTTVSDGSAASPAADLASADAVGRVYLDRRVQVHLDDVANVTRSYRARKRFDASGAGIRVAVLDTGIDTTHPDLDDAVVAAQDFTGRGLGDDPDGHGTHVAGIVAGDGTASDGAYRGVAPNASLLNARVLGPEGAGDVSDVVAALQWATEHDADVVSMSLGGTPAGPSDPLTYAVDNATAEGVTVVTSAGNAGPSAETVSTPGIAASAITVGATDDADRLADFSARGPTPYAGRVKPDLVAPGVAVNSTCSATGEYPCRGTDAAGYTALSGTSMSAPAVSGVAALLEEHEATDGDGDTDLTPAETKTRLVTSTDRLPGYTVYQTGSGRLNATRALASDLRLSAGTVSLGSVVGTNQTAAVTITNTGDDTALLPVDLAVTTADGTPRPRAAATNVTGETVVLAPDESRTVAVEANASAESGGYSARLRFGDGGNRATERRTVSLGWRTAIRTVTVEKRAGSGVPSDVWGDTVRLVGRETDVVRGGRVAGTNTLAFEVPIGDYTLASWGIDETTGQPVLLARTATVDADTGRLTLSENDTVTYAFDGSRLAPDRVDTMGVFGGVSHAATERFTWEQRSRRAASIRVSDGPNVRATFGVLAVGRDRYDYTDPELGDGPAYSLGFYTDGVDGPETFTPRESSLSTLNYTLHRGGPTARYRFEASGFAATDAASEPLGASVGDARGLELRTNNDVGQFHDVENVDAGAGDGWTYALDGDGVLPSSTDGLAVNERPFTGSTEWTFDDAGNLTVIGDVLATQGEHRAGLRDLDARVRVSRNGEVVAQRRSAGAVAVDRAAAPGATYRVSVRTEGSPLRSGPRATMTLDGTNRADADGTPPSVDRLDVPALGLNGGVPAERIALNLTLSDAGEQASGVADVRVRYAPGDVTTPAWENGSPTDTWRTATVTESGGATNRTATLDLRTFTADRVSIAVRVTDGNGNVVVHHSYDSLAVGTGTGDTAPPRPGLSGRIRNTSGPASTNDSVVYYEDGRGSRLEAVVTNGTGQFEATPENGTVELTYLQTNYPATTPRDDDGTVDRSGRFWTKRFARDDTPDLYSLGRHDVDGPTDLGGPVALPEAGTLNVSVVNESGAPVADASVVVRHDAPGGSATARWRNDTDAEGLFRNYMTARPGIELHGDVTITVSPPEGEGYVDRSYSRRLRMDATDERIDVTLVESSTVTGRIETPSGRASGDDLVYLWNESTDEYVFDRTDADGGFEAKNVSPGEYALYVLPRADDGDGPTTAPRDGIVDLYTPGLVDATDDVDTGLTTLPTGHVLNVSVVDAWGEPVSDKRVVISHNNSGANLSVRYATDERGRLTGPDAGTLGVEVPRTVGVQAADGYRGRIGEGRTLTVTEDRHVSVVVPDTVDAPLTVRATPTDATAGEPIRVTLTRSRDGAPVAGTVTTNGTTYATGPDGAVTVTLNRSGTYEIRGQTDLETGRVVTDSVAVEVTADGGGVSRSGGAGGGGGGAGGGGGTPVPPAGIVDVRATDGGTLLTAEQVKGGRLIRTLLPRVASDDLSVEQLSFRLTEDDRRFTAEFTASDGLPSEAEAPAMDGALGYLRVETDGLSDERLGTARLRIAVSETALDEVGAAPADVELYRYHDGEWRAVETRHASGTTVVATTPGFSVFAVGVASAPSDTPTATSTATPTGSPADPTAGTGRTEETAGTAWTTPEPTETTGPGFGVVPGLLALAAVGLLALAARRHE